MTNNSKSKLCKYCNKVYTKDNFHKNKATKDGLHTICKSCNGMKSLKWKKDNPERAKNRDYLRKYGISYAEYGVLLALQKGGCAICSIPFEEALRGVLFVDHCHDTGKVRGLLCQNCNTAIGLLKDSPLLCARAAEYLLISEKGEPG